MATVDTWQEIGFDRIAEEYLRRLPGEADVERLIDAAGDLLTRRKGSAQIKKKKLASALARPSWADPESGEILS